jgi:hypothetical protein
VTNTPHRPSRPIQIRPSGIIAPVDQDEVEKQLALRDVMEHAVRETRAVATAKPMQSYRTRPIILAAIAVPAVLLCAYVFIARPEFMYGPEPAAIPAVRREAYTRFAMYLITQRLLEYREVNRRLPESLEVTGERWDGIAYRLLNDSVFELRALGDSGKPIVLRSDQRLDPFLGNSVTMIKRRRP